MHRLEIVMVLLFVHFLWGSFLNISFKPAAASDVDALLTLKQGFYDPGQNIASWTQSDAGGPCNGWRGISCENSSVVSIDLQGCFTGGQLTSAIKDLPYLRSIDLSNNSLNGSIPEEINQLSNLVSLNLANNLLAGNLPQQWNNLAKLETVTLTGNILSGSIPSGLSQAVNLVKLRLENNSLTGKLPSEITALHRLKDLAIEYNNLTGSIPDDIGRLKALRSLYAAYNQLQGSIPQSIGNLTKLVHFEVESNRLSGSIPASLGNLTASLRTLNLSNNDLSGEIPASLFVKFSSSSFENNPHLCGHPLPNCTVSPVPPLPAGNGRSPPRLFSPPSSFVNSRKHSDRGPMKGRVAGVVLGGVAGAFTLILLVVLIHRASVKKEPQQSQNWFSAEIQAQGRKGRFAMFGRSFKYSYEEIVAHAGYYDTAHVLGKGRFATVYRSSFTDGTELAVKVLKFSNVSPHFEKEIEVLSTIRHRHILPIKGLYSSPVEKAVFYDYLPKGTLYDLLHRRDKSSVALPDCTARLRIAVGIAQAVVYLHRGCSIRILHKDIKSTNVLLDNDLLPRLCDFGLVQLVPSNPQDNAAVVETPG